MKTVLFIIDPQNDFCDPNGSLYVPGAENDMARLADMVDEAGCGISSIIMTADDHLPNDIAHPRYWANADGSMVDPFAAIASADVESGKYVAVGGSKEASISYLKRLEQAGKQHTVWPMHCISGTWGADIESGIMTAVMNWTADSDRHFRIVRKGYYPYTEHYGAFAAEVQDPDVPSTMYNTGLEKELDGYDRILIAGEAKSHCVKNTIAQMMEHNPSMMGKVWILMDAMMPVKGFDDAADGVLLKARSLGARCCTTRDFIESLNQ
ncbi:MAG: isochorismatase family protein [Bacteroidales bacterium]|nr:isochorismatase family protein [Bacteroidales bacterium]